MYVIYNNIYYDYATTHNHIQWNLSNPTLQGSREMCRIVQDYRYSCRYYKRSLSLHAVQKIIENIYRVEIASAVKKRILDLFNKMWNTFTNLF
jgi:hypothetical protein